MGAAIVVYGLSEIFLTLVHPHARGRLTRGIVAGIWRLTSRFGRRARAASGPLAAISVVLIWAAIQAIGWALIYLPHVPDGFLYSEGIDPARYPDVLEALYFSLVSLSTLGFGEVVPTDPVVRLLSPIQAVTGFALLTGGATWLLQLFPTLARRRSTALYLTLLGRARYAEQLGEIDASAAAAVLHTVAQQIASVRVDLSQSPGVVLLPRGRCSRVPRARAAGRPSARRCRSQVVARRASHRRDRAGRCAGGTRRMPAR